MSAVLKNIADQPAAPVLICSSGVHAEAARKQLAAKNSKNMVSHLSDDLSVVAGRRVVLLLNNKVKPDDDFVRSLIDKGATSIRAACIPEVAPEGFDPIRHVNENSEAIWSRPEVAAAAPAQVAGPVDADPAPAQVPPVPAEPVAEPDADADLEAANEAAWRACQEDADGTGWEKPATPALTAAQEPESEPGAANDAAPAIDPSAGTQEEAAAQAPVPAPEPEPAPALIAAPAPGHEPTAAPAPGPTDAPVRARVPAPAPARLPAPPAVRYTGTLAGDTDFAGLMEPVARRLLGEPTKSSAKELRFGTNGSLSVNLETGQWHDFEKVKGGGVLDLIVREGAAPDRKEAVQWLKQRGFAAQPAAVATKAKRQVPFKVVARYPYRNGDGNLLFEVERRDPKDFRQRRPDGQGGWVLSVKGVTQVPYRLPELLAAPLDAMVFLPEGEKDVDNLADLGLNASCNAGGAGKWRDELSPHFAGRHLVLLEDNDKAGKDHVRLVASKLLGIAASVRILALPGLPPKGDVSDWLDAGRTKEELLQLASEAPEAPAAPAAPNVAPAAPFAEYDGSTFFDTSLDAYGDPRTKPAPYAFIRVGDMRLKAIDWLIKRYLEADSLTELFSDPGVGKSFMAIDMACCVATGRPWHGNATTKGAVFYIAGEGHNGLKRRFTAWEIENGVDLNDAPLYVSVQPAKLSVEDSAQAVIDAVRALAAQTGAHPRLIVVDTVARNFGPGDENSTQEMGEFIANLDRLKNEFKATVLLVHHSGHGDKSRARGSMALKGALDAEYRLERGDEAGVIRFEATKMKEAEFPDPLSFRLESVKLPLPPDDEGNDVTSAVVRATMHVPKAKPGKAASGKNQLKALQILRQLEGEHRAHVEASGRDPSEARVKEEDWRARLVDGGINRWAYRDVKKSLLAAALIEVDSGGYVRES